ncbi:hypothetical protein BDV19DRAFT_386084 [Aspergillus venezuelensis]
MYSLPRWLAILAAASTATAQTCTPSLGAWIIANQSDLNQLGSECTTINGSLYISTAYTGPFHLPNIRNVTGEINWRPNLDDREIENELQSEPQLTSFEMPDLEETGLTLGLYNISSLKRVSMPRLKRVGWDLILGYVQEADLRALEWADLDVPSLTEITGGGAGDRDFEFSTSGGPVVNLTFPKLSKLFGFVEFDGDIGSLSMPNLRDGHETIFSLNSSVKIDVNLPVDAMDRVELSGEIASVNFPNLQHLDRYIKIDSTLPLDCEAVLERLAAATGKILLNHNGLGDLQCVSSLDGKSNSGLGMGVKVAIGVVVGVAGLVIIVGVLWFLRKRRGSSNSGIWGIFKATKSVVPLNGTQPPAYGDVFR